MEYKIKLFPDEPINTKAQDSLGHWAHAKTIAEAILSLPLGKSLNIAIYGGWGSGKSSLVKVVQDYVTKETNNVKFVWFDAWRYAHDRTPLRRKFYINASQELRIRTCMSSPDEVEDYDTLYSQTESKDFSWAHALDGLWNFLGPIIILSTALGLILFLLFVWSLGSFQLALLYYAPFLINLFGLTLFGGAIAAIVKQALNFGAVKTTRSPLDSAEQFEAKFKTLIGNSDQEKIVIVIDDLDRCPKEIVIEALEGLKTYFDIPCDDFERKKSLIYLVPCDRDALIATFPASPSPEGDAFPAERAEEFLQKIFQHTVGLMPTLGETMGDYARELLSTAPELFDHLKAQKTVNNFLHVICHVGTRTPRKVKLLLNKLIFLFETAKKLEAAEEFESGTLTRYIPFMAIVVVLSEDFRFLYEPVVKEPRLLDWYINYLIDPQDAMVEKTKVEACQDVDNRLENAHADGQIRENKKRALKDFISRAYQLRERGEWPPHVQPFLYLRSTSTMHGLGADLFQTVSELSTSGNVVGLLEKMQNSDETTQRDILQVAIDKTKDPIGIQKESAKVALSALVPILSDSIFTDYKFHIYDALEILRSDQDTIKQYDVKAITRLLVGKSSVRMDEKAIVKRIIDARKPILKSPELVADFISMAARLGSAKPHIFEELQHPFEDNFGVSLIDQASEYVEPDEIARVLPNLMELVFPTANRLDADMPQEDVLEIEELEQEAEIPSPAPSPGDDPGEGTE